MMKRIAIALAALLCCAAAALAANPSSLESEKFFGEAYRNMKDVELTIVTQKSSNYRNINVSNNPELVARILKAVNKDSEKATSEVRHYRQGNTRIVLTFDIDGSTWTLSFRETDDGSGCRLFVQAGRPPKQGKGRRK